MIILRQNNYTWSEFGKAVKSIGIGAATGATIGFGPFRRQSKIGAAVGGMIGALLGVCAYKAGRITRKEDEKFKEEFREKHGEDFIEVLKKNRPKEFPELKKICDDIHNFNDSSKNNRDLKNLSEVNGAIGAHLIDSDEKLDNYISSYRTSIARNNKWLDYIPVIYIKTVAFGEDGDCSGYVMYNYKTKTYNYTVFMNSINKNINKPKESIKNILMFCLEGVRNSLEYSLEVEKEDNNDWYDMLSSDYEIWKSEYYEKLKRVIEKIRL